MARFLSRERVGAPQIIALALLLALFAQSAWFIAYVPLTQIEANYIRGGIDYLSHQAVTFDSVRSPLISLMMSVPLKLFSSKSADLTSDQFVLDSQRWLIRFPFVLAGLLLGASLWYVARRLYGNTGGYIALGLYAFNPSVIARMSIAGPDIVAAWGAFGVIFTAIAVAHTLYAPREVVLWNWRRILLLGFCIFLMVGAQFSTAPLLLLALAFMLWAVPQRRGAAIIIFAAAVCVGGLMLAAAYLFRIGDMFHNFAHATWFRFSAGTVFSPLIYRMMRLFYMREAAGPTLLFLISLLAYVASRRIRFFGNTAPLLVLVAVLLLGIAMPGTVGYAFYFLGIPFLILFSSGVLTDVIESPKVNWVLGIVMGVLVTQAVVGMMGLAHLSRSSR